MALVSDPQASFVEKMRPALSNLIFKPGFPPKNLIEMRRARGKLE